MSNKVSIQVQLASLSRSRFRSQFHLWGKEKLLVEEKGFTTIREHAKDFISKRLAPAHPLHDGKQTPFKGHPVFIAQHATATCCRSCLSKWHKIEKNKELTKEEQEYILDIIEEWIAKEVMSQ